MNEHGDDAIEETAPAPRTIQQRQTFDNQERFLRAYTTHGKLARAADAAGISINTVEFWQRTDSHGFNKRLQHAHDKYVEAWEQLMDERLANPQGNRGSDILLMFKLKSERPEKYREEVKVVGMEPVRQMLDRLTDMTAKRLEAEAKAKALEEGAVEGSYKELEEKDGHA